MAHFDYSLRDEHSTRSVIILMSLLGAFLLGTMLLVTLLGHKI